MVTRRPIDRSAPIRSRTKRQSDIREAVWSWPGEVTPDGLAASGVSPIWTPFQTPIVITRVGLNVQTASWDSGDGPVVRFYGEIGQLAVCQLDSEVVMQTVNVITDETRFWVIASSDHSPGSDVIGDNLSAIMWYRFSSFGIE